MIADREEAIAKIARDSAALHDLFQDLADIVDVQGAGIDAIETNATRAQEETEQGLAQIKQAARRR